MQGRGFSPGLLSETLLPPQQKGQIRVIPSPTQSLRGWQDDGGSQRRLTHSAPLN